ncbi:MAG TPA: ThiF family adenylyltransferase [Polyangiaceae bacterium]|jgi:molybdopterin/thiamine biosynthesis adenylyltransferase|nr:ThiF family adenylyltransferase [Polyangiaceae bacterium]
MNTSASDAQRLAAGSVLVVGVGGLGCPAALALARAGIGRLVLADDDVVDVTNLHRQILFADQDVGDDKLDAAERALRRDGFRGEVELVRSRFLPHNARTLSRSVDVVVEGADNFATKFLAADAGCLEGRPVVHGSAVRFRATAWAVGPGGRPCYRCLFEDVPFGETQANCAEAGVMGPVTGLAGALMAELALRVVCGRPAFGRVLTYDGLADRLRSVDVQPRKDCSLCGSVPSIFDIEETRYTGAICAA